MFLIINYKYSFLPVLGFTIACTFYIYIAMSIIESPGSESSWITCLGPYGYVAEGVKDGSNWSVKYVINLSIGCWTYEAIKS